MNIPLNPKVLIVFAIPLLVLIYLFANKPNSDTTDQMASSQLPNQNPEMWHSLDLLSQSLPSNVEESIKNVNIEQSEENIGGAATFIQVNKGL